MAFTDAGLDRLLTATGYAGASLFVSAHTGDPGTGDDNEVSGGSYARLGVTLGSVQNRGAGGREVPVTAPGVWNIPGSTTATHLVLRTSSTGTGVPLHIADTTDEMFAADGILDLQSYTVAVV